MKKKKLLALLSAACLLAAVLTGCGGASEKSVAYDSAAGAVMEMEEAPAAPQMDVLYSTSDSVSGSTAAAVEEKLIVRVSIQAETEDLDAFVENVGEKIAAMGGYIEYQDVYNGSAYASRRHRNASMTVRIPAAKLDGFVQQVKDSSNVISYNTTQENVTLTYVATESRLKALEAEQERLLDFMDRAETMTELLEIEARLTDVRYELESVASQLRVLSNKVDYATVDLSIQQVEVYTEVDEQTAWQRIGSGFKGNLENIGEDLVDFFVWSVTYSPQLLIFAAAVMLAVVLIRRAAKKRRPRTPAPPPFAVPPQEPEKKE